MITKNKRCYYGITWRPRTVTGSRGSENPFFWAQISGSRPVGVHQRKASPVGGKRANTGREQEAMEGTGTGPRGRTVDKQWSCELSRALVGENVLATQRNATSEFLHLGTQGRQPHRAVYTADVSQQRRPAGGRRNLEAKGLSPSRPQALLSLAGPMCKAVPQLSLQARIPRGTALSHLQPRVGAGLASDGCSSIHTDRPTESAAQPGALVCGPWTSSPSKQVQEQARRPAPSSGQPSGPRSTTSNHNSPWGNTPAGQAAPRLLPTLPVVLDGGHCGQRPHGACRVGLTDGRLEHYGGFSSKPLHYGMVPRHDGIKPCLSLRIRPSGVSEPGGFCGAPLDLLSARQKGQASGQGSVDPENIRHPHPGEPLLLHRRVA